jgi:hypothetical protein
VENPVNSKGILPFILDILPHLQVGDTAPYSVFEEFLARWVEGFFKPHIVADSAFGNLMQLQKVTEWGSTATLACGSNKYSYLWNPLSTNLPSKHWRCAFQEESNVIASCYTTTTAEGAKDCHLVLSTGWKVSTVPISGKKIFQVKKSKNPNKSYFDRFY